MNTQTAQIEEITEEKAERRFMLQFVAKEDGKRSEPFICKWDELYKSLCELEEGESPKGEDYILLVCVLDGKHTTIPPTPLITVDTFKSSYNFEEGKTNV